MTHSNTPQRHLRPAPSTRSLGSRRTLHRRLIAGAAGVVVTVATIGATAGTASASRIGGDHHSAVVAQRAAAALAAHDTFGVAGTPGAFVAYLAARDATADAVAVEMQLDPAAVRAAWAKSDSQHQEAVLAALSQLGKPYRHALRRTPTSASTARVSRPSPGAAPAWTSRTRAARRSAPPGAVTRRVPSPATSCSTRATSRCGSAWAMRSSTRRTRRTTSS